MEDDFIVLLLSPLCQFQMIIWYLQSAITVDCLSMFIHFYIPVQLWSSTYQFNVSISIWASCQIQNIASAHAPGMPGNFSPPPQVSDPDMHHGTCCTQVPWCMPGSLASGFLWSPPRGKNVPGIPSACATHDFTYLVRGPLSIDRLVMGPHWTA